MAYHANEAIRAFVLDDKLIAGGQVHGCSNPQLLGDWFGWCLLDNLLLISFGKGNTLDFVYIVGHGRFVSR